MSFADPCSLSNPNHVAVKHVHLQLTMDFERKRVTGEVDLHVEVQSDDATELRLDTKGLVILGATSESGEVHTVLGPEHEAFGRALIAPLGPVVGTVRKGAKGRLTISYETTPACTALQFLAAEQTAGGQHPFFFTQCQAIHARTFFPCQDTPFVKATFSATIRAPKPLQALMSAFLDEDVQDDGTHRVFRFNQPVAVPAYLVAAAVGELASRDLSRRCRVWAEPSVVEAAAYEFADTEAFVAKGEELLGEYLWGRYDVLCMPPSFPFGGMENPMLTFVTPTLLAGDRSAADVIIHEISHSWTGNLVTNANWESFWLNEGWTMFVQRKIVEALHGTAQADLDMWIGWKSLQDEVARFGPQHPYTVLVPTLKDVDPDDVFSSVPYEKGFAFLHYLQHVVGGAPVFNRFMRAYVDKFKFKTLTADEFKHYFLSYFQHVNCSQIDWDAWYFAPGMPPVAPTFGTELKHKCNALVDLWVAGGRGAAATDMKDWSPLMVQCFLDELHSRTAERPLSEPTVKRMDELYGLTRINTPEIKFRWQRVCLAAGAEWIFPHVTQFVAQQGRMKYVRPLYRELYAQPAGKQLAVHTFRRERERYHPIATKMIAVDLGEAKPEAEAEAEAAESEAAACACSLFPLPPSLARLAGCPQVRRRVLVAAAVATLAMGSVLAFRRFKRH